MKINTIQRVMPYRQYSQFYSLVQAAKESKRSYGRGSALTSYQYREPVPSPAQTAAEAARRTVEYALQMSETASTLIEGAPFSVLNKRSAESDQPQVVSVAASDGSAPAQEELTVSQIAGEQRNTGNIFTAKTASAIAEGNHEFTLTIGGRTVNLSVYVTPLETNRQALQKVSNTINRAGAGVISRLTADPQSGTVQLKLISQLPGTAQAFGFSDVTGSIVSTAGLNSVTTPAVDAVYTTRDGSTHTSVSNEVSLLGGSIKAKLLATTSQPARITVTPDAGQVVQQLQRLASSYNHFRQTIQDNSPALQQALAQEFDQALEQAQLGDIGLNRQTDGLLQVNEYELREALNRDLTDTVELIGGNEGIAAKLKAAADGVRELPVMDLLNQRQAGLKNYASYLATAKQASTMPVRGLIVNAFY
ncbi:hypothetical protein [Paenibacillus sp. y28]|uniref:hypothetical protein n=1 Tax=Paenibacillus sp. y28 TaxID=3129110 RepID=UPI0030171579